MAGVPLNPGQVPVPYMTGKHSEQIHMLGYQTSFCI